MQPIARLSEQKQEKEQTEGTERSDKWDLHRKNGDENNSKAKKIHCFFSSFIASRQKSFRTFILYSLPPPQLLGVCCALVHVSTTHNYKGYLQHQGYQNIAMADFPPNLSIRPLTIQDIDQCIALEKAGFPKEERCSPEKFKYRLTVCPELCSGLFIREYGYKYNAVNLPAVAARLETEQKSKADGSQGDDGDEQDNEEASDEEIPVTLSVVKETLIGHIIATKTYSNHITEQSMSLPSKEDVTCGHIEQSRYIGVHSLVIDDKWRGKNLGTLLMHDYIQKLSNQDLGSKVVIIAKKNLVSFYEKIGFVNQGKSECEHGGSSWCDLSIDLVPQEDE